MHQNNIIYYFILGLGCKKKYEDIYKKNIADDLKIPIENIKIYCNYFMSTMKDILSSCLKTNPLQKNNFVNKLTNDIINDIITVKNTKIIIYGHSYGGAIINKVAQNLNLTKEYDKYLKKLNIFTTGSIFIAPNDTINKINILNYISLSDIAIKCNKIKPLNYDDLTLSLNYENKIICLLPDPKKNINLNPKIIQLCLFDNRKEKPNIPVCSKKISILKFKKHFLEHNLYFQIVN
jgi:hypothetical protein